MKKWCPRREARIACGLLIESSLVPDLYLRAEGAGL